MKKQRKHYTPEEKVAILRRRLLERRGCLSAESAAQPFRGGSGRREYPPC